MMILSPSIVIALSIELVHDTVLLLLLLLLTQKGKGSDSNQKCLLP